MIIFVSGNGSYVMLLQSVQLPAFASAICLCNQLHMGMLHILQRHALLCAGAGLMGAA